EKRKQRLEFQSASEPVRLDIDPARLTQVLTNLVTNAIKYTPEQGQIKVRVEKRGDQVQISVKDNGLGLTRYELNRIFEIFHQARSSMARSPGGLGIGLSVAKSLAELHGGGVIAESNGPGTGSTFVIWLPLTDAAVKYSGQQSIETNGKVDTTLL